MGLTANDIPADIIIEIIGQLKEDLYRECYFPCKVIYDGTKFPTPFLSLYWIKSTQFCRTWRLAALNCSSLWTDISVSNWDDNTVTAFLARSGGSHLRLVMNLPIYDDSPFNLKHNIHISEGNGDCIPNRYTQCLEHLHRTRSLDVSMGGWAPWSSGVLEILQSTEMPVLEHFSVDGYALRFFPSITFKRVPFSNCTPRLRSVALRSVTLPSDSSILQPSDHLSLELVECQGKHDLATIFSGCSSLTRLRLDSVWIDDDVAGMMTGDLLYEPIQLPNLQSITICGSTILCNRLRRICQYPAETGLNIAYMFLDVTDVTPSLPNPIDYLTGHVWACIQLKPKSLMEIRWENEASRDPEDRTCGLACKGLLKTFDNSRTVVYGLSVP